MSTEVDLAYFGVLKNKLNATEEFIQRLGAKYHFTDEEFAEVDKESIALANETIKKWENPVKNYTTILCFARINSLLVHIEETRKISFGKYIIDMDGVGISVICHGEEL